MDRKKRFAALLLTMAMVFTVPAFAAGVYHAPVITVVAPFAPGDLEVSVRIVKKDAVIPVVLESQRRGWEMQYMLRREAVYGITTWYGNAYDFQDAVMIAESGGETKTIPIPAELLSERGGEDYFTLNWRTGRLTALSKWRAPALLLMWSLIAMAAEGLVFYLYGYRSKRSWIVFFLLNLVTQSAHHMLVSGINVSANRIKVYVLFIPVLFLVEMLAYVMLVDERSRDRTVSFAVVGNLASQAATALLMGVLPA